MSIGASQDFSRAIQAAAPIGASQDFSRAISQFRPVIGGSQAFSRSLALTAQDVVELDDAPTGLTGTLTVSLTTTDGNTVVIQATTKGITEFPAGSGRYLATIDRPAPGHYLVVWSDGTSSVFTSYVVEFFGELILTFPPITPPRRKDGIAWTKVLIEEADSSDGDRRELATIDLDPVDSDPAAPQAREITVANATNPLGWYHATFVDASESQSLSREIRVARMN